MIGGNFNSVSGVAKHRVARIKLCTNSSTWMAQIGKTDFHLVIKQLFLQIIPNFTTVSACSCQISEGKTVTVPAGNSLSLILITRVWEP
jgi:hypothetical protein